MRLFLAALACLVLLWSGWWVAGSNAKRALIAGWFQDRRDAGWAADYDALAVRGYPTRFDTTLDAVTLADTRAQIAWTAPHFALSVPAWHPTRVTATWPAEQWFSTPQGRLTITSDTLQGDLLLAAGPMLALRRAALSATRVALDGSTTGGAVLDAPRLAIERIADSPPRYAIAAGAGALSFDMRALRLIDPDGRLPATLDTLRLDMTVAFDAPLDRRTIEQARPGIVEIDLTDLTGIWGQLELRAAGRLLVDADGMPEGLIQIKAVNWRDMLAMAEAAGAIPPRLSGLLARGLEAMAGLAGNPRTLDIPLAFRGGAVWLGVLPVGPAPLIVLR